MGHLSVSMKLVIHKPARRVIYGEIGEEAGIALSRMLKLLQEKDAGKDLRFPTCLMSLFAGKEPRQWSGKVLYVCCDNFTDARGLNCPKCGKKMETKAKYVCKQIDAGDFPYTVQDNLTLEIPSFASVVVALHNCKGGREDFEASKLLKFPKEARQNALSRLYC